MGSHLLLQDCLPARVLSLLSLFLRTMYCFNAIFMFLLANEPKSTLLATGKGTSR